MAGSSSGTDAGGRKLVFQVAGQFHEIDARGVREVIRVPHITRVPHGPEALAGIINLRGKPVPVLEMNRVLGGVEHATAAERKIIIYDRGEAVGLLVEDVLRLSAETTATPIKDLDKRLDGAFKFARRPASRRPAQSKGEAIADAGEERTALLTFSVAGQLYGLPLEHIREVAAVMTDDVTILPDTAAAVMGLLRLRDTVLPLVSLAALLGLDSEQTERVASRIIVVEHGGDLIALAVDGMDLIRRLPAAAIDAVPAVLQRGRGDAQIEAIGRVADEALLIAILSPEKLFGHQAVAGAIEHNTGAKPMNANPAKEETFEQFLIFQLSDEVYGLPIGSVDEVIRVPDEVTRVPGAPAFVMGIINLRGKPIPLIDQRDRFVVQSPGQTSKARAIIVTLGDLQAGFVVDSVSEVKAIASDALSAAPEFSSDRTEVFDRIAQIEADGRMILLIDPQELLTRAERDVVLAITGKEGVVTTP